MHLRLKVYSLVAVLLLGGIGLAAFGTQKFLQARQLAREGKPATAVVLQKRTHPIRNDTVSYHLVFAFDTAAGQRVTNDVMVKSYVFSSVSLRGPVNVIYLASDPSICIAGGVADASDTSTIQMTLGGVFAILGIVVLVFLIRSPSAGMIRTVSEEEVAEKLRPQANAAAQQVAKKLAVLCVPRHEFAPVDPRQFKHLDLAFYDEQTRQLEPEGFRRLADLEDITLKNSGNNPNTFIRMLLSRDGSVIASAYHFKPGLMIRLLGVKEVKVVDFESWFDNGCFVCTSNAEAAGVFSQPTQIDVLCMAATTSPATVLAAHRSRLIKFGAKSGARPVCLNGLPDVLRAQAELQRIKAEFRSQVGLSQEELRKLGGPVTGDAKARAKSEDLLFEEIAREHRNAQQPR